MKLLVIFASVFVVASALTDQEQWVAFKAKHNKVYKNIREEELRFKTFQDNIRTIEAHNAKYDSGHESYFMGVNKFADLTNEEFRKTYFSKVQPPKPKSDKIFVRAANATGVPYAIDWRDKNVVTRVKDQGDCGSCWAFSAIGALESQNAIKHGQLVSLSEQELVDCSNSYNNGGCFGGDVVEAFKYVKDNGISTEASYPYDGNNDICKNGTSSGIKVTGYNYVLPEESALRDAVGTVGPTSVRIVGHMIRHYAGGIFANSCRYFDLTHAMLVVGYGHESGTDYWIVKNSWGTDWGENGYMRIVRNQGLNCGISDDPYYPIID